jgi:hypothetical protein
MGGTTADEPTWHISKLCEGGACIAVGTLGESILIGRKEDREGSYATFTRNEWQAFVAGVKDGDFDSL